MKDILTIETSHGYLEVTVQSKDIAAHCRMSDAEEWQLVRSTISWLLAGFLKGKVDDSVCSTRPAA